ncbi:uncharacterized protein [Zea mays]|uniref:Uncharacterized protein n=1 Tax=Zea mays TaxID=4577 RepID=A0A1D6HI08_MAIZE|nr:uncharacterized protein LOC100279898 [Zea mays]XP_008643490.1 uncharacterized protein LOC100279898 isoform X2 [Zea mays]XP_008643491.1 uncharacterized protein LOC100279898 isoform X2 [Zea mays]AQK74149.1 hypothetical protein ZEAMMB73_Zm00001d017810 [Zea mays]|eukprot:XP_008643489.1 uncharacterized protein LOC100279898 isoform X2 [Zea mays]
MENHGKLDGWDEVLEEEDELASVCKYPISTSYLSYGTSRRGKSVKKPRFSLRGYDFVPLDVKTDNLCIGEQDGSSAVPSTKASQTMVAERLENVEEQTEDLAPEFALPPKANTLVSELLDNLQRRGGSFVRTPSLLHQHAPSISIREQEVSSGVPPTKASQALMDEPFENDNGQTEELPSELPCSIKRPKFSVAELLEDLQGRSGSYVETASLSHQHTRAKHWKPKFLSSEKKTIAILGDRSIDSEDPLEHVIDGTSSEEEDATQNHLSLVNKDENQQTMADLFQEVFNPTNMDGAMKSMRSTGAGNYGRMQQIMHMEKDWHVEFSRQYSREHSYSGDLKGTTVQIMSRSLEGKLTVCSCMFQEKGNDATISNASADGTMDESRTRRTIIFSPKICNNVDLLVGNIIHIFPPWKEVKIQEEHVIICTYFSHHHRT